MQQDPRAPAEAPLSPSVSLYQHALHELAARLSLDPAQVLASESIEAEGVRFHFQQRDHADAQSLSILAEIGEIPAADQPQVLRQLLEANAHLNSQAGTYALIPGTDRAAVRVDVALHEGQSACEPILAVLTEHIAACTAVRHLDTSLLAEPQGATLKPQLA
jgi:hypothetical protein